MRRVEKGFTLIELVIVLVILGILSAVAIPKFQDFSNDAKNAAFAGGAASVASALAIETAKTKAAPIGTSVATALPGSTCTAGRIQILGSGSNRVYVTLIDATAAATGCATAIVAIGTGKFSV